MAFAQEPDGVLYIGENGLMRFDGDRWRPASPNAPVAIYGLDWDSNGRLWTAANDEIGWFDRMADGQWNFHSLKPQLRAAQEKPGPIERVFSFGNGAVFIGVDAIYRWTGAELQTWPMVPLRRITGFRINGDIYFHYRREGLFKMTEQGPKLVIPQNLIGARDTVGIYWIDAQSDRWLLATTAGLLVYKDGVTTPFAPRVSEILRNDAVTSGVRLPDGRLAFGTAKGGIVFVHPDGSLDSQVGEQQGLPGPYVPSLFVDRQGNLWGTGPAQVFRIDYRASSRIFDQRADLRPSVQSGITEANGQVVLANRDGAFALAEDGQHFAPIRGLGGPVIDLVSSDRGAIICSFGGSVNATRFIAGKTSGIYASKYDISAGLASLSHPGEVVLCEYRAQPAVIVISPDGRSRDLVINLPTSPVTSFAEDRNGHLWMATTNKQVFIADRDSAVPIEATPLPPEYGLPPLEEIPYIRGTPQGDILVFSGSRGWIKTAQGKRFAAIENLPRGHVVAVSRPWNNARGWTVFLDQTSQQSCVGEIVIGRTGAHCIAHAISNLPLVGNPQSIFAENNRGEETVLWIGGSKSVLREVVRNGDLGREPQAPILTVLAQIGSSDVPQPIAGRLPYSTRSITFDFANTDFANRASLRLETRINGIDNDWIPAPSDSRRQLTALREGKYTFKIRAVAATGQVSEPTVFDFEVAPPWWRTAPAFVGVLIITASSAYAGYRLRVRALRQRNALLERKVQERTEELAEASAAKTMFVANMSHDIRNPLNGIVGLALALEDTKLDTQQREIVATLRECTTYLSSLVDDVLDFASIEAGKVELRLGPFVPAELLNSVVTTLRAEANERGALITIETDPDLPPMLRGDAGRIQQILVNYVSNALKYAGGHITLAAAVSPNAHGEVEFSVTDEGPGISESDRDTLFTKFSRLSSARQSHIPGTGLGLASCRLLADIMSGSVGVESQRGAGARFYLRLPIAVAVEPPPVPADIAIPQTNVLLVEDTDYNALAATAVLRKLGLTCDRARNGEEALKLFAEKRHNVVLLDRNLPDIDGAEVARRMRALEADGPKAVLLAVTAYCTSEDRILCVKAGMDAFLGKPLTPDKLRRALIDVGRRMLAAASVDAPTEAQRVDVDVTLLEYMADGIEGGLTKQKERFISALADSHDDVLAAARNGNMKQLGDAAHRILGHARMVGATGLSELSVRLETAARTGNTPDIGVTLPLVAKEIDVLTEALRRRSGAQKV